MRHAKLLICAVVVGLAAVGLGNVAGGAVNHPAPGVFGRVTAGPTCPVERPGQQCAPRPVSARVKALKRRRTIASTTSNSAGGYDKGARRRGTYTIRPEPGSTFPPGPAETVTVRPRQRGPGAM